MASASRLPEYPVATARDLEHVQALAERIDAYLTGVRETRALAEQHADTGTFDLLSAALNAFEKNAWFLRATLA